MTAPEPSDEFRDFTDLLSRAGADDRLYGEPPGPSARVRRRRRIRTAVVCLIVLAVIAGSIGTYVSLSLGAPVNAPTLSMLNPVIVQPAATVLSIPAGSSAVSVMGADDFPGVAGASGILAASGGNGALPIASISKLITAMVILDRKPLTADDEGPTLTFSKADADLYDRYYLLNATIASMKVGSSMSERDAIETMLVVSACNYAEAVSTWAFGSQSAYLRAAKRWLASHGFTGTTMVESTGLDARNTSTPTDLIGIGKLALANPVLATIVKSPTVEVPGLGMLQSNNHLLGDNGVDGIKTGTLDEAGACLLFSASLEIGISHPLTIVGVVLGGQDHVAVDHAVSALLRSIQAGFRKVTVVKAGELFGEYSTEWNDSAKVVADGDASIFVWSNTPVTGGG